MQRDTIAAVATAAGRAGIGVIRISGPDAAGIACRLAGRNTPPDPRHACLTPFLDAEGNAMDRGILLFFPAPHSYTGEDVVELQAHGSPVLLGALLMRVFDLGARPAEPGEFTRRAVENGRMDLTQAEAVAACIDAATERAARLAQRHLAGEFGRRVQVWMDELTALVARVEAALDFPEDDLPPLYFDALAKDAERDLLAPLMAILESAPFGERLLHGATVAIVGAPNVGKSSLLNRLSGRDRAIVSDIAGTTRDVLEVDFEVRGIPIRLVDTAGLRDGADVIEQEGVRRAREAAGMADLVIFVADATRRETWSNENQAGLARIDLRLMNKIDTSPDAPSDGFLPVSAKTGQGLDALRDAMARQLGDRDVGGEDMLVCSRRHAEAIELALRELENGVALLGRESEIDLVAAHWRRAWHALGGIVGIGDVEHILDRVFADFCIGK